MDKKMKEMSRVSIVVAILFVAFSILGCKHPTEPEGETRTVDVEVRGDRPFYYEGSWDNYNQKLIVDSTQYREWSGFIQWGAIGYARKGSSFRVYAKSLDSAGYVSIGVSMHTGYREAQNVIVRFSEGKESRGGAVEITVAVP